MFKKLLGSLLLNVALAVNAFAADRTIAIAFLPPGATVSIHVATNPDKFAVAKDDNGDGYVPQQIDDALGDSTIAITADGFQPYAVHFKFKNQVDNASEPRPLNQQVNVGLDIPNLKPLAPPAPPLLPLQMQGIDLVGPNGQRVVLNGLDYFVAFRHFLDGNMSQLEQLAAYSHARGFNLWRVFMQGSIAQNTILQLSPSEPGYFEKVRPFADWMNAQGIWLLATVYVDNQDIHAEVPAHFSRMADALRGSSTFLSGGNEYHKNGYDPGQLPDPNMFWSRGSDLGDAAPFQPAGLFMEFHPRRDLPAALMDTVASPVFIYGQRRTRLFIDEPPRMGTNGSGAEYADPRVCWQFARHYATEVAAAVFHNYFTMRGLLPDGGTDACAIAWTSGMRVQ